MLSHGKELEAPMPDRPLGLHRPEHERGSCGVGFLADLGGRSRDKLLKRGLRALENLSHRGAVAADRLSGDGAGILTAIPYELLPSSLVEGFEAKDLAVGSFFLASKDDEGIRKIARQEVERIGAIFLGWREVPLDRSVLGEEAAAGCPEILHLLVARGRAGKGFEELLFLARRRIEKRCKGKGVHIASLSSRTLVYKGMVLASRLSSFYLDLANPDYRTSFVVFHQRFSTNTSPSWSLAQPFRLLAHNGEINTLLGNRNWMRAREKELACDRWGEDLGDLLPLLDDGASDSAMLDQLLELLVRSGRDPLHAMAMLVPDAWEGRKDLDDGLQAFYEYHSTLVEPWDGPAALVACDGRLLAAALDRNGLRPLRYWVTDDDLVVLSSEAGVERSIPALSIRERGRLGPGQLFACDLTAGKILRWPEIGDRLAAAGPWREWVSRQVVEPPAGDFAQEANEPLDTEFRSQQMRFGLHREVLDRVLSPMAIEGKIPVGSMGDDTPIAALSSYPQSLYRFFRQRFAQVTNPPIDPLRERSKMSLRVMVGPWGSLLQGTEERAHLLHFSSPILDGRRLDWLLALDDEAFRSIRIATTFPKSATMQEHLERICGEAEQAADRGYSLLVLSDRGATGEELPIPMLLAISAVHQHLISSGQRMRVSLVAEVGDACEDHDVACLIGFGATLVLPWLAYRSVRHLAGDSALEALSAYRRQLELGLLKTMAKMGIGPVTSYQGAQTFEILGLEPDLVKRHFGETEARLGGLDLKDIENAQRVLADESENREDLPDRGFYRYRRGGEEHAFAPAIVRTLRKAARDNTELAWDAYRKAISDRAPLRLRDFLDFERSAESTAIEEVEPADRLVRRFCTQAMSHGALSRESHEVLAVAMNRLGGRSNSGEGGEARERFVPYREGSTVSSLAAWRPEAGDWGNSAVKQIASGRFGVTAEYLTACRELEIKMAQGAKPGEGGQIPGHKVTAEIARIRHSVPGVTLISPPPHHDIYSIEDLAQLIYDLKRVNPLARIGVKLASSAGVGTIAAGVVKGYADVVTISGHDGGTGATPLSSMRHAGVPWELGLAETQQVLVELGLRGRTTLRVDSGLQSGRDVVIAALLGAEEFGFGTAALVATGCIMARRCHLNVCPVGIATQRPDLREKFPGTPDHVIAFLLHVAEDVRVYLADLGFSRFSDIVGRVDLLRIQEDKLAALPHRPDLRAILFDPDPVRRQPRKCLQRRNDRPEERVPLDDHLAQDCEPSVLSPRPFRKRYQITNRERSVGARLAGLIAQKRRDSALPEGLLSLSFTGTAGQSFGAFCTVGMRLELEGEAQDYVGKSMSGGQIIVRPPTEARYASHESVIVGNTVLYGATGGSLYAAGLAGERFAVRNSGARAVVEGCGDHACEYMTRGVVVVLGDTGVNFGAGMSGGVAFVLDLAGGLEARVHPGTVRVEEVATKIDQMLLRRLVERHLVRTGSQRASWILDRWSFVLKRFRRVRPHLAQEDPSTRKQDPRLLELDELEILAAEI